MEIFTTIMLQPGTLIFFPDPAVQTIGKVPQTLRIEEVVSTWASTQQRAYNPDAESKLSKAP